MKNLRRLESDVLTETWAFETQSAEAHMVVELDVNDQVSGLKEVINPKTGKSSKIRNKTKMEAYFKIMALVEVECQKDYENLVEKNDQLVTIERKDEQQGYEIPEETLLHEGFEIGQVIKAYDFEPRTFINNGKLIERDDYVIGRIKEITTTRCGAKGYKIEVIKDNAHPDGYRTEVVVPMEIWGSSEWEGRVTIVHEN